jgi:hypothetical protein
MGKLSDDMDQHGRRVPFDPEAQPRRHCSKCGDDLGFSEADPCSKCEAQPQGGELLLNLLPCPFCGGKAKEGIPTDGNGGVYVDEWEVCCDGCEVEVRRPERVMAHKDWNRRADLPRATAAWQPDPHTWEPQHVETLCACRTFDVGLARAYLDGCEFLHTTVQCPSEKFSAATPRTTGETTVEASALRQLAQKNVRAQIEGVFGDQAYATQSALQHVITVFRERASDWEKLGLSNAWYGGKAEAANELIAELELAQVRAANRTEGEGK